MGDVLSIAIPDSATLYTMALIFFRITGFILPLPILGATTIPDRIKIILIVAMSWLIYANMPAKVEAPHVMFMAIFCAKEFILGLGIGFVFLCIMQIIFMAGELTSMQMGLSFSSLVDPETHISSPIIGQFFHVMMILLFLSLNVHLALLQLFSQSIHLMPLGTFDFSPHFFSDLFDLLRFMTSSALLISLPIVLILLMMNLATGIMSKAASQLNIFAIGLPVSLLVGLFVLILTAPMWGEQMNALFTMGLNKSSHLLETSQ